MSRVRELRLDSLRVIEETPGDVRSANLPMSPGARRWQRDMLEMPPSISASPGV